MIRATLRSLLSRKARLLLSALAVTLGVTFVAGASVLGDSLNRSFDRLFAGVYADTDVEVSATPKVGGAGGEQVAATVSLADLDRIRAIDGVASATGLVTADGARLIGSNGKTVPSLGPPRLGGDWTTMESSVRLREGRGPSADNEIAINAALAKAANVKVGDQVGVLTLAPKQTFTLVGIFGYPGGQDSLAGAQMIAFTLPVAQQLLLGEPDVFSSVDVKAADGVSNEALKERIAQALGAGYTVRTGAELADANSADIKEGLAFFGYLLNGFAAVSLFVACFLILNTFSIIVAQRSRELALLRALGANRRQMIGSVLVEAVVVGVVAAILGLALGVGVGALLARVFGEFGAGGLELAPLAVPGSAWISAFSVGIGITVLAALLPAVRASRIPPVAAMREAATPDRPLTTLTASGGVVLALGGVVLGLGLTGHAGGQELGAILGGVLLAFVGAALLTPLVVRPVAGVVGRLFAWSTPGLLGRLNAGRNPRRTAITAAALMVGIALITGINTVITSAKSSITRIADEQAQVDLIVAGDAVSGGMPTFDPAVLDRTAEMAGVTAVTGLYMDVALVNGERTYVGAFSDIAPVQGMFSLRSVAGDITSLVDGQLLVDDETASAAGLTVGSPVTVQLARGEPVRLVVSGIYARSDLVNGYVVPANLVPRFTVALPTNGFIQVQPGFADSVQSEVDSLLRDSPEVSVASRTEYIQRATASADQVVVMVQVLLALAILIAVLGVINTLALSVIERTREIGLLRAVGLGRAQTMRMITVEAVVIAVFGALLGLLVGTGLGAAVVRALKHQGITDLALPWGQMVTYLVLAVVVGVVAAVLPAIRAARINVLRAISYE